MTPEEIAKLILEDQTEDVAKVTYVNHKGEKKIFNIIPELTEDAGSVWVVALSGTGEMGVKGPSIQRWRGLNKPRRNIERTKNTKLFINPRLDEYKRHAKEMSEYVDIKLKEETAKQPEGLHDVDVWETGGKWRYEREFKDLWYKQYGSIPDNYHSRRHRNDTYKRISLVKSRILDGLPGPKEGEEIRGPKEEGLDY